MSETASATRSPGRDDELVIHLPLSARGRPGKGIPDRDLATACAAYYEARPCFFAGQLRTGSSNAEVLGDETLTQFRAAWLRAVARAWREPDGKNHLLRDPIAYIN